MITCGLDSDDVLSIDGYDSIRAIIAIPWLATGLQKWTQTWTPTELRGKQEKIIAYPEPSCVVKKAMEELTGDINTATGITHPSDEREAKTFILALHKYESSINADIVGAYLVKELNWETEEAKKIETMINTLNTGKYFQGRERTGLREYYNRWKEDCNKVPIIHA